MTQQHDRVTLAKQAVYQVTLWWSVLAFGLWVGGTLFDMTVIVPLWSSAPPTSVKGFFGHTNFPATVLNFFGPPWMLARALPLFVCTWLARSKPHQRKWLAASSASMIVIIAYTLVYIYPVNAVLINEAGGSHTAEDIRAMVEDWIMADRIRFCIGSLGYLCLLKAFSKNV